MWTAPRPRAPSPLSRRWLWVVGACACALLLLAAALWPGAAAPSRPPLATASADAARGTGVAAADATIARITKTSSVPFQIVTEVSDAAHVSAIIRQSGGYAPVESAVVSAVLRRSCRAGPTGAPPPLVLDVGANLGYFALMAAAHGCRVVAYEPSVRLCGMLAASAALNGVSHLLTVVNAGVGSAPGMLRYAQDAADPSMARVLPDDEASAHLPRVPVVTLADELAGKPYAAGDVLLIKMDTEGFEPHALRGLAPACGNRAIENVVIEVKQAVEADTLAVLFECLDASAGYAGVAPVARGMWFREWYSPAEINAFHAGAGSVSGPSAYGTPTPHGYVPRLVSPWKHRVEDVWYSLRGAGWEAAEPG